jgi:hypothetical protein
MKRNQKMESIVHKKPLTSNDIAQALGFARTYHTEEEINLLNVLMNICRVLPIENFKVQAGVYEYEFVYSKEKWSIFYIGSVVSLIVYVYHKEIDVMGDFSNLECLVTSLLYKIEKENLTEVLAIELKT